MKKIISILLLSIGSRVYGLNMETNHPRMFMNAANVQTMVDRCYSTKQPYRDAWLDLNSRAKSSRDYWVAQPYTGSDHEDAFDNFVGAGRNMLPMTFRYLVTGDTNCAEKVVDSLLAYASANPKTAGLDAGLPATTAGMVSARGLIPLLYAYDLIYNYGEFSPSDKNIIESWFLSYTNEFHQCIQDWNANDYHDKQYWQNHVVAAGALGPIAVGTVVGDESLVQFGFNATYNPRDLLDCIEGTILVDGDSEYCSRENNYNGAPFARNDGEIYDRYRHLTGPLKGFQYATLSKQLLFYSILIMDRNNTDLWEWQGVNGESILMPFEYYSDYYRLMDSSLKDGFYFDEDARIGIAGDEPAVQEAFASCMDSKKVDYAVTAINRLDPDNMIDDYMGHVVLTHGYDGLDYFSVSEFRYVNETGTQRDWAFFNLSGTNYGSNTLWGEATHPHPYFSCAGLSGLGISLDAFQAIEVRIKHDSGIGGNVTVYWNRIGDGAFSTARKADMTVVDDGDYTVYTFDVSGHSSWNGTLEGIRIDPFAFVGTGAQHFWVDYVRLQYAD